MRQARWEATRGGGQDGRVRLGRAVQDMLGFSLPYLRAVKYRYLWASAQWRAGRKPSVGEPPPQVAFVIGCGRSGTSILGEVLGLHPSVRYFFEPYHLWAAVDEITDVTHLYTSSEDPRLMLDESSISEVSRHRFASLFLEKAAGKGYMVEKTPHNAVRVRYLDQLAPGAKYIHIVRDGQEVSRSIERVVKAGNYRVAGWGDSDSWWGRDDAKWRALAKEGSEKGHFADEVALLMSHRQRGAYEWVVTMREVDAVRERLQDRLYELKYESLMVNPMGSLRGLVSFLGLDWNHRWAQEAAGRLDSGRRDAAGALELPPKTCAEFNRYQERYGFPGRVMAAGPTEARAFDEAHGTGRALQLQRLNGTREAAPDVRGRARSLAGTGRGRAGG